MELIQKHLDQLTKYENNARTHSKEQIQQIATSIQLYGFNNPILIDESGEIIAGHGRFEASHVLGLELVPCIVINGLTPEQKKAYVLADNQIALNSGWDIETLRSELIHLNDQEVDLDALGFSYDFIADLIEREEETDDDEEKAPETAEKDTQKAPVTKRGDLWTLGKHRILCGDSTIPTDVEKLSNGQKALLLHADPPYGMGKEKDGVQNDNLYNDDFDQFMVDWWNTYRPHLLSNASAYIWGNAPELWRFFYKKLEQTETITVRNHLTWRKGSAIGVNAENMRKFPIETEHLIFFVFGKSGLDNNAEFYFEGFDPVRQYLYDQRSKSGLKSAEILALTNSGFERHSFNRSQWTFPTEESYNVLQKHCNGSAFNKPFSELKKEYQKASREFKKTHAYFDNTHQKNEETGMTDVWYSPIVTGADRHGHATPKPIDIMIRILKSSLPKGGLVLEPFGGSGSTLIGAQKSGRVCYTMELSEKYCDTMIRRWQTLTGKDAIHESGKTFNEMEAQ